LLEALKNDDKFKQAVKHSDYVTLTIGSNDLLRAFVDGIVAPYEVSLILANLKNNPLEIRSLTDAPIVVYNVYNPFQVNDSRHIAGDNLLPIINTQIQLLTSSVIDPSIVVADAYSAFRDNQSTYVIVNDIHPTVEGQKKLAEIGLKALSLD
jgi:lysophospholipase L1-like esterase